MLEALFNPTAWNAVPEGVKCTVKTWCNGNGIGSVCARVCDPGSVQIDPWLRFAVDFQWRLARRQPLCFAQWLGTHNSAITLANGYGLYDHRYTHSILPIACKLINLIHAADITRIIVKVLGVENKTVVDFAEKLIASCKSYKSLTVITNDQSLSLTDQLNLGVRFMELDTHYFAGDLHIGHCGGKGDKKIDDAVAHLTTVLSAITKHLGLPPLHWDTETVGCEPSLSALPAKYERKFSDAVSEVAEWLSARPGEFIVLYLDDQKDLENWDQVDNLLQQVTAAIPREWFITPPELYNLTNNNLGKMSITMDDLVQKYGKRIMLMSGSDLGPKMKNMTFNHTELCGFTEPNFRGFYGPPVCAFCNLQNHGNTTTMTGRLIRTPTCNITYGMLNCSGQFGDNNPQLDVRYMPDATACGINVLAPDQLTPAVVQSYIWSWAPGERPPQKAEAVCVLMRSSDGRWVAQSSCGGAKYMACRLSTNGTQQSHSSGDTANSTWALAAPNGTCPTGYLPSAPLTAPENYELWQVLLLQGNQPEPGFCPNNETSIIGSGGSDSATPAAVSSGGGGADPALLMLTVDPALWQTTGSGAASCSCTALCLIIWAYAWIAARNLWDA